MEKARKESRLILGDYFLVIMLVVPKKGNVVIKSELYKNAGWPTFLH